MFENNEYDDICWDVLYDGVSALLKKKENKVKIFQKLKQKKY